MENHIHIVTQDIRWASCFAGAANSARTGLNKTMNPKFTISFEPTTPLIAHLASRFDAKPINAVDYEIPPEERYPLLDYFTAMFQAKQLEEQHGIKKEPNIIPLYIHALAANSLLMTHSLYSVPGYYFPKFSRKELSEVDKCDVLVELDSFKENGIAFAKGMGIENPVVVSLEEVDEFTGAKMLFNCRLVVTRPYHAFQYIMRSFYEGIDHLGEYIPVASIIDDTVLVTDRYLISWNGQVPIFKDDSLEYIEAKGKAWKIRSNYGFDHRKFYVDQAKGTIKV